MTFPIPLPGDGGGGAVEPVDYIVPFNTTQVDIDIPAGKKTVDVGIDFNVNAGGSGAVLVINDDVATKYHYQYSTATDSSFGANRDASGATNHSIASLIANKPVIASIKIPFADKANRKKITTEWATVLLTAPGQSMSKGERKGFYLGSSPVTKVSIISTVAGKLEAGTIIRVW